jgi:hypothetical protein
MPFKLAASLALLQNPKDDRFHGLYTAILNHWFLSEEGCIVESQARDDGEQPGFVVVKRVGLGSNAVLVVDCSVPINGRRTRSRFR